MVNLSSILLTSFMATACTTAREKPSMTYTTKNFDGEISGYSYKITTISFDDGPKQEQIYLETRDKSQYLKQISARLLGNKVTSLTLTSGNCETIIALDNGSYEPEGCLDFDQPEIQFALERVEEARLERDERIIH